MFPDPSLPCRHSTDCKFRLLSFFSFSVPFQFLRALPITTHNSRHSGLRVGEQVGRSKNRRGPRLCTSHTGYYFPLVFATNQFKSYECLTAHTLHIESHYGQGKSIDGGGSTLDRISSTNKSIFSKIALLWAYISPYLSPDSLGFSKFLLVVELLNSCLGTNVACMVKIEGFMLISWHFMLFCMY